MLNLVNGNYPDKDTTEALLLRRVEELLYLHPEVEETAVIYLPLKDEQRVLTAFIITGNKALSTEDLKNFLRDKGLISSHELPGRYHIVEEIPKTPSGKCHRLKLIQDYGEG